MEMVFWHAVVAPQMTFGLVPEILNSVDVIPVFGKLFGMIDADMMEVRDIKDVIGLEAIRMDDAVGAYLALDDRDKCF